MTPETYFLAAIVGIMLAGLVIKGWRRILPCLAFCLFLPELKAQGYDSDDDVPTLTQIRDQIIAQQTMLDNYFSGYTAPNKLNDISNSLTVSSGSNTGNSLANTASNIQYWNTQTANNTADISNALHNSYDGIAWLQHLNHRLSQIQSSNSDISNSLNPSGTSANDYLKYINRYLSGYNTTGPLADISNSLETIYATNQQMLYGPLNTSNSSLSDIAYDVDQSRYFNQVIKENTADISNYSEDSLTELQDISNSLSEGGYSISQLTNFQNNRIDLSNQRLLDLQYTQQKNGYTSAEYLNWINNDQTAIRSNTATTNSLLANLDQDNDVPAIQSLESLLSGYGQWDTDNDVDAIEAVEAAIDGLRNSNSANFATQHVDNINIVNAITALQSSVETEQASPQAPSVTSPEIADAPEKGVARNFDTVNNDNGNINDTTIKDTIINDVGEFYVDSPIDLETSHTVNGKPSFFQSATQKRDIVAGSFTLPNVQGSGMASITADINASMQTRMAQATPIVMPIFTGYLLFMIGRWTLDTSNSIIAS